MNRISGHFRALVPVLLLVTLGMRPAYGQTVNAGELVFTSFDATGAAGADAFSFIPLVHLHSNTEISFTDRGFSSQTNSFTAASGLEGTITWTPNVVVLAGTEIKITGTAATIAATGAPIGWIRVTEGTSQSGYNLSTSGDQLFAFQGTLSTNSIIAGLHFNVCNTSDATWDATSCTNSSASQKPASLTTDFNCLWTGSVLNTSATPVAPVMGRFNCTGTPITISEASLLRRAITNKANWTLSATSSFSGPAGCTYIVNQPPTFTAAPQSRAACAGTAVAFNTAATDVYSYQWQVSTTGVNGRYTNISNGANYAGVTTAALTISNLTAGFNGYYYRAIAINPLGTDSSSAALLTIDPASPPLVAQLSDVTVCPGGTAILAGLAGGSSLTYKWQTDTGSGFVNISDGSIYSNAGTSALTIAGVTRQMYGNKYRFSATSGCGTVTSNTARLTLRNVWTGSTGTNWNTPSNWSCGVIPDSTMDIVINTSVNSPVMTANSRVRNITISAGGSLSLAPSTTLTIKGDLVNLGTFNTSATGATVIFSSPNTQSILPFGNVGFNGSGNKLLKANMTANGTVTFNNGSSILLGDHSFTLGPAAAVHNAGSTQYFMTNGRGGLRKNTLGTGNTVFPVGTATAYNPVTLSNNGTPDNFTVRVADSVYPGYLNDKPQGAALIARAVSKTWYINEDIAGGSDVNMTVQWSAADELNGFNRGSCFISHFSNNSWNPVPGTPSSGTNPYIQGRNGITSFSPFAVGNYATPLPLQLINFSGTRINNYTALKWTTSQEQNITNFEVERSGNGSSFYIIGTVGAQNMAAAHYAFTDNAAMAASRIYYRLKINEQNGAYSYTNIIAINQYDGNARTYQVSPNPLSGNDLFIRSAETGGHLDIMLVDMIGKIWHHSTGDLSTGDGTISINTQSVPAGYYVLRLKDDIATQYVKIARR